MAVQPTTTPSQPDPAAQPLPPPLSRADLQMLCNQARSNLHPLLRDNTAADNPPDPRFPAIISLDLSYTQKAGCIDAPLSEQPLLLLFGVISDPFPVCSYPGFSGDPLLWDLSGDCVVFVNNEPFIRTDVAKIRDSDHGLLIGKMQELSAENLTEWSATSGSGIRFVVELASGNLDEEGAFEYTLALRNFFAVLTGAGVVGLNLISALTGVQTMSEQLQGIDADKYKSSTFVRKYIQTHKFDDCRFMRNYCANLLAWCEQNQWGKGYVETFAHCVGMIGYGGFDVEGFTVLTNRTKELLDKSWYKQLQTTQVLKGFLADFDIVGSQQNSNPQDDAALQATEEFRKFLIEHYTKQYGQWPPNPITEGGQWLTRPIALQLQNDFGSLYDLLVDDTLTWRNTSRTSGTLCRVADDLTSTPIANIETVHSSKFALQDVIAKWNRRCDNVPLPLPFPKMPTLCDTLHIPSATALSNQASLVPALRGHNSEAAHQRTLTDAYSDSFNCDIECLVPATDNQEERDTDALPAVRSFAEAFVLHELNTHIKCTSTHDARLGRWLVIHCVMQMLARVAVDIQGLHHGHNVPYFLNACLKGCPPWPGAKFPASLRKAGIEDSWAWMYARSIAEKKRATAGEPKQSELD